MWRRVGRLVGLQGLGRVWLLEQLRLVQEWLLLELEQRLVEVQLQQVQELELLLVE